VFNNTIHYKNVFDEARKSYPGTKRGLSTEFENYRKKHSDWMKVLPLLKPAIERQTRTLWADTNKRYIPHFLTWLNQRRWELETEPTGEATFDAEAARQREELRRRNAK
jgi:hypothetical protein